MDKIKKADGFKNEYLFVFRDEFLTEIESNELFNSLMITDIGYFPYAKYHFRQRTNGCETAIFIYCSTGEGFYSLNGEPREKVSPGQVIIIPPDTPHVYGADDNKPWSIYWIHIKGNVFQPYYKMLLPFTPVTVSEVLGEKIREFFHQCFSSLRRSYQHEEYFYLCQLVGTTLALVLCAGKESGLQLTGNEKQGLDKALAFIQDHLTGTISLKQIAEAAQLSPSHLNYLFKRSTGHAPIEYFLQTKIHASSKDLYFSNIPVKDIAMAYGIDDPYYFSRQFKKIMGVSPIKYRSQIKG